ncbi:MULTISPECIES: hypothetical protein [Comamonadaceae]|uniref:hypothetical protein n=1 Tax=Comamonadaceae TaxID=80864 RepID=UPI00059FD84C|nr:MULTISPECIES: hypothetical protein [Comamonadaceae]
MPAANRVQVGVSLEGRNGISARLGERGTAAHHQGAQGDMAKDTTLGFFVLVQVWASTPISSFKALA